MMGFPALAQHAGAELDGDSALLMVGLGAACCAILSGCATTASCSQARQALLVNAWTTLQSRSPHKHDRPPGGVGSDRGTAGAPAWSLLSLVELAAVMMVPAVLVG